MPLIKVPKMKNINIFTAGSLPKFKKENKNLPLELADFVKDIKIELSRLLDLADKKTIYTEWTAPMDEPEFITAVRELGISVTDIWETPRGERKSQIYK